MSTYKEIQQKFDRKDKLKGLIVLLWRKISLGKLFTKIKSYIRITTWIYVFFVLLIVTLIYIVATAHIENATISVGPVRDFNDNWFMKYQDKEYRVDFPFTGSSKAEEQIEYYRTLEKEDGGKTISFLTDDKRIQILVEDTEIYSFAMHNQYKIGKAPGDTVVFATLPMDCEEATLRILTSSPYDNFATTMADITIGDLGSQEISYLKMKAPDVSIVIFIFIESLAFLAMGIIGLNNRKNVPGTISFGFALFMISTLGIIETKVPVMLFGNPFLFSNVAFIAMMMFPLFLEGFYFKITKQFLVFRYCVFICSLCNVLLQTILQLLNIVDYQQMGIYSEMLILIAIISGFCSSIIEIAQGKRRGRFSAIFVSSAFFLGGGLDLIRSLTILIGDFAVYTRIAAALSGFIYFISAMVQLYTQEMNMVKENLETAQAASIAKDQFLANMSHEIRTPINGILGMNEMILKDSKEPVILEYASDIKRAGTSLLTLVNEILDVSKVRSGGLSIEEKEYETFLLFYDSLHSTKMRGVDKGLQFITKIDKNIPCKLWGDGQRIRQIIVNLLTNAIKYTEKGSVAFTCHFEPRTENTVFLIIEIQDTGYGIEKTHQHKIFEAFYRMENKNTDHIEGTGLGLSLVKSLVKMMNGYIEVESAPGEGSTFRVIIPQEVIDENAMGDFEARCKAYVNEKDKVENIRFANGQRILVVDDEPLNLKVVQGYLRDSNLELVLAGSGKEAITYAKEQTFDLIILDHRMPEPDGIQVFQEIIQFLPADLPIIMMSANASNQAKEDYLNMGFTDYLSKPSKEKDLQALLKEYLQVSKEEVEKTEVKENPEDTLFVEKVRQNTNIDVDTGLSFNMEDASFYKTILLDVFTPNRAEELSRHFQNQELVNYQIKIHSLKSLLKTVGALDLSKEAADLENACKNKDTDYLDLNHDGFVLQFIKMCKVIERSQA